MARAASPFLIFEGPGSGETVFSNRTSSSFSRDTEGDMVVKTIAKGDKTLQVKKVPTYSF